ncbi:hypothetical protein K2W90_01540 [Candidatus Babeliales bacterium]|nr:hypothetical protein [Candidatus Babeliales bacterium]
MKKLLVLGIVLALTTIPLYAQADWTILNYIEANNNLSFFANNNIEAMKLVGSTSNVNILVQLSEPTTKKTWRYKIKQGGKTNHTSLNKDMGLDPEKELIDAVLWAHTHYPAKRFMLIFWNHGGGIIDKHKSKKIYEQHQKKYSRTRSILYNYQHETFLTNQQLERALKQISEVRGKKIDIIGMDACLMASIEIAYQIKDYADYFIASENVEIAPGWCYGNFLRKLIAQSTMSPLKLMETIISSFASTNAIRTPHYTLSAIKLDLMNKISDHINNVILAFYAHKDSADTNKIEQAILKAHAKTNQFENTGYLDAHHLFFNIEKEIKQLLKQRNASNKEYLQTLITQLHAARLAIRQAVVYNQTGSSYQKSKGLTLYYPKKSIHNSYENTRFALDTLWLSFIKEHRP